jgi:ribonuclease J
MYKDEMDFIDKWMNRVSGDNKNSKQNSTQSSQKGSTQNSQKNSQQNSKQNSKEDSKKEDHPKRKNAPFKQKRNTTRHNNSNSKQTHRHKGPKGGHKPPYRKPVHQAAPRKSKPTPILKGKLKMIPLGGLNEVGKNMMAIEYEDDIIILDMGFEFPSEDMLGIDYVIPDVTYLEDNKKRIRGVVLTHGHLDHIGGIPYILPKLDYPPVYGTRLTQGLVKKRLEEFKQEKMAKLMVVDPDKKIKLGKFLISFFRVNHSIPDCVGIVIDTPVGKVVDTGDFKFDPTPARNLQQADIKKIEALGSQNVLALFCESTNALKPGHSMSEKDVGETLEKIVRDTTGRLIIASFSSQIGRIQQIIDAAVKCNRKIYISGRSMRTNIEISAKLGYLNFPKGTIQDIRKYKTSSPDRDTLIITTGSQGESVSALSRMAKMEHSHLKVKKGDTIVLSSSPIVGNEKAINKVINMLTMLGAEVIHNQLMDVHTSGHGKQDELARMINYIKPKYLMPIHGEYYMRMGLSKLAQEKCNLREDQIIMLQNGDVLLAEKGKVYKSKETVDTKYILIDGSGEGNIGSQVQVDREIMSQNGSLIVLIYVSRKTKMPTKDPDVVSRGFIYMNESDQILKDVSRIAKEAYKKILTKNSGANRRDIKRYIQQTIDGYSHKQLERRPLIVPLIIEN